MAGVREIAFNFEAKKHAIRQTADGWVVSFIVHPNDIRADFAVAALGTRYMIAAAQIGDDEQPVSSAGGAHLERQDARGGNPSPAGEPRGAAAKERYATAPHGEQAVTRAALLPKDARFQQWCAIQIFGNELAGVSAGEAEEYIRERCCDGKSRKLIASVPEYMDRFIAMETDYKIATGLMPEVR